MCISMVLAMLNTDVIDIEYAPYDTSSWIAKQNDEPAALSFDIHFIFWPNAAT